MAWNNGKQMTAEEILGMKPEDMKARLDSAVTKEDLAAATAKIEEQASTLSELKQMLSNLTSKPIPEPKTEEIDPTVDIITDPTGFVTRHTQGLTNQAAKIGADVQEMRARQKYGAAFSKYGDDLMKSASAFSAEQRAGDNFWDWHLRTFLGDKYIKGETGSESYPSLIGSSSFAPNSSDPDSASKLSADEQKFFKEHNVKADDASWIKKHMVENGEPISLEAWKGRTANA